MNQTSNNSRTVRMVQLAVLAAIIVVLQMLSYSVLKIGQISVSLVLVPIVAGGIAFGPGAGALLGGIFGVVTLIGCISGIDVGGQILFTANPYLTTLICLAKGILCGWLSALLYAALHRKSEKGWTAMVSAILCPVVNTGVFLVFTLLFFRDILQTWAAGTALLTYVVVGLVGFNFLIELLLNILLAPPVSMVLVRLRKSRIVQ